MSAWAATLILYYMTHCPCPKGSYLMHVTIDHGASLCIPDDSIVSGDVEMICKEGEKMTPAQTRRWKEVLHSR